MYYSVVSVTVTDPNWVEAYMPAVQALVEKHGGRYLVRAQEIKRVEGQGANPNALVVIQWPNEAAANTFYQDPAYAPYLKSRLAGSKGDFFNVAGLA
jgi:uncharacterized protein (DUF1330 family)